MTDLTGSPIEIKISQWGECYLYAPDFIGTITELDPMDDSQTRSVEGYQADALDEALDTAGLTTEYLFEIDVADDGAHHTNADTRSGGGDLTTRQGEPAILLTLNVGQEERDYVVLYKDEGEWCRWIWPDSELAPTADEIAFALPRPSAPEAVTDDDQGDTRGPLGRLGQRLVRVLTFVTDPLLRQPLNAVARRLKPEYGFLQWTEAGFRKRVDWAQIHGHRTLLLLHGTYSHAEAAFAELLPHLDPLTAHYPGGIIAFNHPTLPDTPKQNLTELINRLPETLQLDLDLLTHSRGGLVGRELCEHLAEYDLGTRQISIRRAVFVAVPHQGTILTDGAYLMEMLDRYTNALVLLPDEAFSLSIEGVLAVVKLLGHGALNTLPGLQTMHPQSLELQRLNGPSASTAEYYALGANFTPQNPAWIKQLCLQSGDKLIDSIFKGDNDLIVPTMGTYQAGHNAPAFPIPPERRRIFDGATGVHHCNFFGHEAARVQIFAWLTG